MYVIATNIVIGANVFLSIFAGEKILKIPFIAINDETAATMNLATAIDVMPKLSINKKIEKTKTIGKIIACAYIYLYFKQVTK